VAAPSSKRRKPQPRGRRPTGRRRLPPIRIVAALLVLAVVAGAVLYLAWRAARPRPAPAVPDAGETVRDVAGRYACPPGRVSVEPSRDRQGELFLVTVHAPRGFPAERFTLDLEATAHNLGGRLEPQPLTEKGGYGLARLEGSVGGTRWRVLVLGEEPPPRGPTRAPRAAAQAGRLAIVLDDAGASMEVVREVERLPLAVAVAVLPNAAHSAEVARALGAQGREVLLHMPMEALANHGPGPGDGAVEVGLPAAEVRARLERALQVVAPARGVNNHMGSRATADAATMRDVMVVLAGHGLYFLDSRTTSETVAERVAHESGVPALRRDVFLDVVSDPDAVHRALEQAVARARAQGSAVAIGHVHPLTIELLAIELPRIAGEVKLVRPSQLLRGYP
jgi:polysaccharide deacetylase 2 family uncharacterized protein YibQ